MRGGDRGKATALLAALVLGAGGCTVVMVERPAGPGPAYQEPAATAEPAVSAVHAQGRFTVRQTWMADLDKGRECPSGAHAEADFWFEAKTATARFVTPRNGALLVMSSGRPDGPDECARTIRDSGARGRASIHVNRLRPGTWVCARTSEGRYAAFTLTAAVGPSPGKLLVQYVTWGDARPAEPEVHSQGRFTVRQTWMGDLDKGRECPSGARSEADFWFEAKTATKRCLVPKNGAKLAVVSGRPDGPDECARQVRRAGGRASRQIDLAGLRPGTWVCARTSEGRYAAFSLTAAVGPSPGRLQVQYVTWAGAEPPAGPKVHAQGRFTVRQTWTGDLDKGQECASAAREQADLWFRAKTATERYLVPKNGAKLAVVSSKPDGPASCARAIRAAGGRASQQIDLAGLRPGTWVCARTSEGRYAAFTLTAAVGPSPGKLRLQFVTWEGSP